MSSMNEPAITTEKNESAGVFSARPVNPNGRDRESVVETEPTGPPKTVIREYFESAVVTVILALFGITFIVQACKVPTGSMQNTITVGDHLLVNKFIFAPGPRLPFLPQREIRRGDIIVFKYPGNPFNPGRDQQEDNIPYKVNYVKRVIGLPGDTVEVKGIHVFIDGKQLPEHLIVAQNVNEHAPLEIKEVTPRQGNEPYDVYYFPETVAAARAGVDLRAGSDFNFAVNGKPAKIHADSYFV